MDKIQYTQKEGSSLEVPVFNGRNVDRMHELVAEGYSPISVAGIMDLRNNAFKSGEKDWIEQVCYNYFDSGDSVVYDKNTGNIKIVWDSRNLRGLTPKSKLEKFAGWSALNLEKEKGAKRFAELPEEMNGVQLLFNQKEQEEFFNKYLTEKKVPKNLGWLALARGDENRLGTYAQNVYSRINDPELIRVWVTDKKSDFEAERLWCFFGLDYSSNVNGNSGRLDVDYGRLVGVAPKVQACDEVAPIATKMNLEALMGDFRTLADEGFLTPKAQELYVALQKGKYNL